MQSRTRRVRRVLAARGLVEAVTWSFIPPDQARLFGGGAAELTSEQSDLDRACADAALAPAWASSPRRSGTATAALPMALCSSLGRPIAAPLPRISSSPRPACASAVRRS